MYAKMKKLYVWGRPSLAQSMTKSVKIDRCGNVWGGVQAGSVNDKIDSSEKNWIFGVVCRPSMVQFLL